MDGQIGAFLFRAKHDRAGSIGIIRGGPLSAADPSGLNQTPSGSARSPPKRPPRRTPPSPLEVRRKSGGLPPLLADSERPRGGMAEVSAKKFRVSARAVRLQTSGPPWTFDGGLRHQADSLADFCPPKRTPSRKSERTPPYSGLLSALLRTFVRLAADFCPPCRGLLSTSQRTFCPTRWTTCRHCLATNCQQNFLTGQPAKLDGRSFLIHTSLLIIQINLII